jgi:hypothetical protein
MPKGLAHRSASINASVSGGGGRRITSSKPASAAEQVQDQAELQKEILSQKTKGWGLAQGRDFA